MMNELGEELFAGATFARQQHRGIGRRDFPRAVDGAAERGGETEDPDLVAILAGLFQLLRALQRFARRDRGVRGLADQNGQLHGREGLRQVGPGADADRFEARRERGLSRDGDHPRRRVSGQGEREQLGAGDVAHVPIHQDDIEQVVAQQILCFARHPDRGHVVTIVRQDAGTAFPQRLLIFDNQNADVGGRGAGW